MERQRGRDSNELFLSDGVIYECRPLLYYRYRLHSRELQDIKARLR